jgi:hypothetical protein
MFTRREIIDYSVRMGCKRDLAQKGMVVAPSGDVFCIASLNGNYPDHIYYMYNKKSPKEVRYCGVYSVRAGHRLDPWDSETRKNIAVTKTDGKETFVYFFEKTRFLSNEFFFHGRYKYLSHELIPSINPEHKEEILFHLLFVDKPVLR